MCINLPTSEFPVSGYTASDFYQRLLHKSNLPPQNAVIPTMVMPEKSCVTGHHLATVTAVELLKSSSWLDWRHESVVFAVTHNGKSFFVHVNRAWDAPPGWQEYVPFTWGSQKPSSDDVSIYIPSEEETEMRKGTQVIARIQLKNGLFTLGDAARILAILRTAFPMYALLSVNCWSWSRYLTIHLLVAKWNYIRTEDVFGLGRMVGKEEVWSNLVIDRGQWYDYMTANAVAVENPSAYRSPLSRYLFTRKVLHHLTSMRSPFHQGTNPRYFYRVKTIEVQPGTTWHRPSRTLGMNCTTDGIPHTFTSFGLAQDIPINPYANSLCTPGKFLYLLTSPIDLALGHRVMSITVAVSSRHGIPHDNHLEVGDSYTWIEYAIVRPNLETGALGVVGQRFKGEPIMAAMGISRYGCKIWENHPVVAGIRDGDMIGVWARGPDLEEGNPPRWVNFVSAAYVFVDYEKNFEESRSNPISDICEDETRQGDKAQGSLANRNLLEFGRMKYIVFILGRTRDVNYHDCTTTGIPHSFNSSGLATDTENPQHSNSLCEQGDFLYLLTSVIITENRRVASITFYTWSLDQGDASNAKDSGWLECGVVRQTPNNSGFPTLTDTGERSFLCKTRLAASGKFYRNRVVLKSSHPLIRSLQSGDMIGVWVRTRDHSRITAVQKALVVVKLSSEPTSLFPWLVSLVEGASGWSTNFITGRMKLLLGDLALVWRRFVAFCHPAAHRSTPTAIQNSENVIQLVRTQPVVVLATETTTYIKNGPGGNLIPVDVTHTGLPHAFDITGHSDNATTSPFSNSLCGPGDFLYLLSPPLRFIGPDRRVVTVTIKISSHDQGFSSYPDDHGTQNNSHTWFECGIVRRCSGSDEISVVSSQRVEVGRNFHARGDRFYEHEHVLDERHELVRALRGGDMIGVWARAEYPGWINFVRGVRLVILTETVKTKAANRSKWFLSPWPWNRVKQQ